MMDHVNFLRFKASDGVELQGWLNDESSDVAVIHIHGMSGNGYENYFLDDLREMYRRHDISLFTIDNRGRGIISNFRQGDGWKHAGSCFEIFEESIHDIRGAIDHMKSLGKTRFILQGHSLGCAKIVNFVLNETNSDVEKIILLAPTDMVGYASTDPKHNKYLKKAALLLSEGKGEELVDAQCWTEKTPISAQTYLTICKADSLVDIYGGYNGNSLLSTIKLPTFILYGTKDIGIKQIDGSINNWYKKINKKITGNNAVQITVINGASHDFRDYEKELTAHIEQSVAPQ
jgi:alpha-beta hydrolase superfamily lysophospholipase